MLNRKAKILSTIKYPSPMLIKTKSQRFSQWQMYRKRQDLYLLNLFSLVPSNVQILHKTLCNRTISHHPSIKWNKSRICTKALSIPVFQTITSARQLFKRTRLIPHLISVINRKETISNMSVDKISMKKAW